MIAPLYDPDTRGEVVCFAKLGNLGFGALNLGFANSNVDGRDALDRGEGAERVNENGDAVEGEKLLGLTACHAGPKTRGGKNRKYLHTGRSIAPSAAWS